MAYYLAFDGVNDYVRLPFTRPDNMEINLRIVAPPQLDRRFLSWAKDTSTSFMGIGSGNTSGTQTKLRKFGGGGSNLTGAADVFDGNPHDIKIKITDNLLEIFVDGGVSPDISTTIFSNATSSYAIWTIGAVVRKSNLAVSSACEMDLYSFNFEDQDVGASDTRNYDPSASNGTGQILPDTEGNNDGTLVNFPTDDSQWIFYDDGGSVDYTITLDSGNYSLTGNSLALLSDRNISLENGSYSLTGTDLNLAVQRSISLSDGIYSKQGTNTNLVLERLLGLDTVGYTNVGNALGLLAVRSLPLEQGFYSKDGSLLSLFLNRTIALEQGDYSYLGSDINLQYGQEFRLSLEQGTYSLQGTETGLLKDYILPLETKSYSYAPENISLLANRKINTESGDYSYTGSPINFIYEAGGITYTLSIDSGSYSLTGQPLNLLANRRLPIDFGEYTYEGVDSDILYNRVVALDSGVYTSAGTDTGLRVNRRLVFQNGNYSLQGTPITLSYTGEVLAMLEGYRLSYKKHPIKQLKYKPYNITARYN